jgi:hypothetical protein
LAAFRISLLIAVSLVLPAAQPASDSLEFEVKAAMLLNIARFAQWPEDPNPPAVCVVGKDPFGSMLDDAFRGRPIQGRTFEIRRLKSLGQDLQGCRIVWLGGSERKKVTVEELSILTKKHILLVSDAEQWLGSGGMVIFRLNDGKVRFEVDLDLVNRAGLSLSSRLLSMAIVRKGDSFVRQ